MTGLVIGVVVIVAFVCIVFSLSVKTSVEDERRFAAEERRVRNWRRRACRNGCRDGWCGWPRTSWESSCRRKNGRVVVARTSSASRSPMMKIVLRDRLDQARLECGRGRPRTAEGSASAWCADVPVRNGPCARPE